MQTIILHTCLESAALAVGPNTAEGQDVQHRGCIVKDVIIAHELAH